MSLINELLSEIDNKRKGDDHSFAANSAKSSGHQKKQSSHLLIILAGSASILLIMLCAVVARHFFVSTNNDNAVNLTSVYKTHSAMTADHGRFSLTPIVESQSKKHVRLDMIRKQHIREAIHAMDNSELIVAQQILATLLAENSHDWEARTLLAKSYYQVGQYGKAIKVLTTLLPDFAANPDYYDFMAVIYLKMGQPQLALSLFNRLKKISPDNPKYWFGLSVALDALGHEALSQQALKKASDLSDGDTSTLNSSINHGGEST